MNIIRHLTLLLLLLSIGCERQHPDKTPAVAPATIEEIAQAVCLLNGNRGQGVLVGFNDRNYERVFLLTARHIATDKYAPDNRVDLIIGGQHTNRILNSKSRWFSTKEGVDTAWIELSDDEINDFRANNALHYIALTNGPNSASGKGIPGVGTKGYEEIVRQSTATSSIVTLFFRDERLRGEGMHNQCGKGKFYCDTNRKYTTVTSKCITVIAPKQTPRGECGGPAFTLIPYGRKSYWMLSGLIIGGNSIYTNNCAVVQLDEAVDEMRLGLHKLIDHPELW